MRREGIAEEELLVVAKRHHRGRGERLRDRGDAKDRVGGDRAFVLEVRGTFGFREDDVAVYDERERVPGGRQRAIALSVELRGELPGEAVRSIFARRRI